jgi:hypothetical protein
MTRTLRASERRISVTRLARHQRERLRQQTVSRQNRQRFTGDDMQRRLPPTQRVVVHRRQIVVDQRIRMNELDRAGRGHRLPPITADGFGTGKTQNGPQPFAARTHAVPHRVRDGGRTGWR